MARLTDPWTSHEAQKSVQVTPQKIDGVLRILTTPMTDEQMIEAYEKAQLPWASPSGLRTLRVDLHRKGFIEDTGVVAKTRSGRKAIVWKTQMKEGE
jgi:hypothetical protein